MAKKKLKTYALYSEIISAVAVIVSLIFVAFQVKDNTAAVRSSTYDDILSDHIEWRMTVASNPELLATVAKTFNSDSDSSLSEEEQLGSQLSFQALWQIYERAYFARKYETLGDSEWARYEKAICRFASFTDVEAELGRYLTTNFIEFAASCNQPDDH